MTDRGPEEVTEIITRENRVMYRMAFADGRVLKVSEDHPLFVVGKGYASVNNQWDYKDLGKAAKLEVGDYVLDQEGNEVQLISIEDLDYPQTVYTFSTSGFYANGFLVY